jgi:7,8-dihydropterin-6-yl-methyl-4-(beta-D-ribofuranosyl)aminobenzene 5'-phosphate synthase
MCADDTDQAHLHQPDLQVLHDFEPRVLFDLEPVDTVTVTTLMDNVTDIFMPDQGPAHRAPIGVGGRQPAATMEGGDAPVALLAEHGFSVLVTWTKDSTQHQILFDAGTTPDGMVENMRRLEVDPSGIEAIVCSHGHFDHTTGLDGLIRRLGRVNLPVLIHPQFWRRRRVSLPGRDPIEIPSTSRGALVDAGFEVIEEQQPSFLFDRSVLVTGEVPCTTGYEPGFPPQQAWVDGRWEPDPLVLDEQGFIVDIKEKGAPGNYRLRPCRHRHHLPLRPTDDQGPPAVRRHGRLPSQRADLRAAHPPGPRRPGRPGSLCGRPGPLHRMAGPARHERPLRRGVHPQLCRDSLRVVTQRAVSITPS